MNKKKIYLASSLLGFFSICLTSCGAKNWTEKDYIRELDLFKDKDEVSVLHITDLHWSFGVDVKREKAYLQALIKNTNPDIIVCTGDVVLQANKLTWGNVLDTLDSLEKPYFISYGNHEYQGLYRPTYPYSQMLKHKNCLNLHREDDIDGESNFVVNLTDGNSTKYQLFALDSKNLYRQWSISIGYDVINEGQLNWYKKQLIYANPESYDGLGNLILDESGIIKKAPTPSLVFTHIPLWQIEYAYRLYQGEDNALLGKINRASGYEYESVYSGAPSELKGTRAWVGYRDPGTFALFEEMRSTKGVYFGHDHKNNFAAEYYTKEDTKNGSFPITLAYGMKTGDGLSSQPGLIGANIINIKSNGDLQHFRAYQEYQSDYSEGAGFKVEEMF